MHRIVRAAVCATALLVAACGKDSTSPPEPKIEETTFAPALGVDLATMTKTPDGLYYKDLVVGTGATIANGQLINARYTGWFPDGTQFDSNVDAASPYPFNLGRGQVIAGWDLGLVGMKVGGKRQLVIPPSLGYGPDPYFEIPGNSILVFQVEVVSAT
jgi:FKBP-type peptidyl-prolyl cis-trans isomerase FkpA